MRDVPGIIIQHLQSRQGIEPIIVVGINWSGTGEHLYADRDFGSIRGKVVEIGSLESVTRLDGSGSASDITITLDDSDNTIKPIFDSTDPAFKPVSIYQYFGATGGARILLFEGALASPMTWRDSPRRFTFSAVNRKWNTQVGYSLDESNLPIYHQSLLGVAWPMIFGTPIYVPCVQLTEKPSGFVTQAFGVVDPALTLQGLYLNSNPNSPVAGTAIVVADATGYDASDPLSAELALSGQFSTTAEEGAAAAALAAQIAAHKAEISRQQGIVSGSLEAQQKFVRHSNKVIGGYAFPQSKKIICKINEQLFTATFLGGGTNPTLPSNPDEPCPVKLVPYYVQYDFVPNHAIVQSGFTFIQAGSKIEMLAKMPGGYKYVASITPGDVQNVYAYRSYNGIRKLTVVPAKYYTIEKSSGVTYIVLDRLLSTISFFDNLKTTTYLDYASKAGFQPESESLNSHKKINNPLGGIVSQYDWEDDLYVNFASTIGPNAIDVMIYLIQKYTSYTYDHESFDAVRGQLTLYPVNFALLDRPVVDQVLQDIAYQCRCALTLKQNRYHIRYLSRQPAPVDTIHDSDVVLGSLEVGITSTDEIVTKYVASYQPDYVTPPTKITVKNNVDKYGLIEEEHNYYCFNNYELVLKSATFWLIRKSYSWKTVTLQAFLQKLAVETLDPVTLALSHDPVGSFTELCEASSCVYEPGNDTISLTLWTGIVAGEKKKHTFAWPGSASVNATFPLYSPIAPGGAQSTVIQPAIGKYNGLQDIAQPYGPGGAKGGSSIPNLGGYIIPTLGPNGVQPLTHGDPTPTDSGDQNVLPHIGLPATLNDEPYPDVDVPLQTVPVPPPIYNVQTNPEAFVGRILGGGGALWSVEIIVNAVDGETRTVAATQTNPGVGGDLTGQWVDVVMRIDNTTTPVSRTYMFTFTPGGGGDIGIVVSGSGDTYLVQLYPNGFDNDPGDLVTVIIPSIDPDEIIEPGTKINGITKTGEGYYYQPPVWLP